MLGAMPALELEVWSDIACPWCYVGKRRLEGALKRFPHAAKDFVVFAQLSHGLGQVPFYIDVRFRSDEPARVHQQRTSGPVPKPRHNRANRVHRADLQIPAGRSLSG